MRRWALWCVCLAFAAAGAGAGQAQAQAQQARTLTLTGVSIDPYGRTLGPPVWTLAPRDSVIRRPYPDLEIRYSFPLPDSVSAQGAPVTLTLYSDRGFGGDMRAAGEAIREGQTDLVQTYRNPDSSVRTVPETITKTITLDPARVPVPPNQTRRPTTQVNISVQDGPVYTYTYELTCAGSGDGGLCTPGGGAVTPPPRPPAPRPPSTAITNSSITPAQAFGLPSAKRCVSRRNFVIRLKRPGKVKYLAARVNVNGRQTPVFVKRERYLTIRGRVLLRRRLAARVDLRGLRKGTFRVTIVAVTKSLRTIRGTRQYRTCEPKRR